ncbi:MAG: ribonuclease E/G [Eubacteriales bacterium]|nr:ribonuclease E/G [Eubacteriales bacterium]
MSRIVITRWKGQLLTVLFSDRQEPLEIGIEEENSILGNIYIGRVNRIVKNLNSAFVDYAPAVSGYYSLADNQRPLLADGSSRPLKGGDEIIVQVARDAVKTKDPVLSSNLTFPGRYAVLTAGKNQIGFSMKITDKEWKESVRPRLEEITGGQAGIIVRTNAYGREEELFAEAETLFHTCCSVMEKARSRSCFSLLSRADAGYIKMIQSCPEGTLSEVITDDRQTYEELEAFFRTHEQELCRLRFYEDPMISLSSLYSLEAVMDRACQKRVWLKSGGYLVIEYTEAMTVIDVNTGKYSGHKNQEDTIRMTNDEAAAEIIRQLRLRNLSGIIMVDFIDMKEQQDRDALMNRLRELVRQDPVKTQVVDMTRLNLVEITRKKEKKPLWEQIAGAGAGGAAVKNSDVKHF